MSATRFRTVATLLPSYTITVAGRPFQADARRRDVASVLKLARATGTAGDVVVTFNGHIRREWEEVIAPECTTPGCTRDASYDGESDGYFSTCDRCHTVSGGGLHAHRHGWSAAQLAGDPRRDPNHTWITSTILRPVVEGDEIVKWECTEPLPDDRGACGYEISRADVEAHHAFRRGEAFLNDKAWAAHFGHGIGPQTNGHEVWNAYTAMRDAWNATHPTDVR
jgi:hypothetical protein